MTALTARLGLICQLGPSSIKTHLSPAVFTTTLSLYFVPFPSPTFPHRLLVPGRAELRLFPCQAPSLHRTDTTRPVGKMSQRDGRLSFARRLGSIVSSIVWPRASTPDDDADEAPGVPAGRRRRGHATASDAGPLLSLFQASSTNPSHLLSPPWSTKAASPR